MACQKQFARSLDPELPVVCMRVADNPTGSWRRLDYLESEAPLIDLGSGLSRWPVSHIRLAWTRQEPARPANVVHRFMSRAICAFAAITRSGARANRVLCEHRSADPIDIYCRLASLAANLGPVRAPERPKQINRMDRADNEGLQLANI